MRNSGDSTRGATLKRVLPLVIASCVWVSLQRASFAAEGAPDPQVKPASNAPAPKANTPPAPSATNSTKAQTGAPASHSRTSATSSSVKPAKAAPSAAAKSVAKKPAPAASAKARAKSAKPKTSGARVKFSRVKFNKEPIPLPSLRAGWNKRDPFKALVWAGPLTPVSGEAEITGPLPGGLRGLLISRLMLEGIVRQDTTNTMIAVVANEKHLAYFLRENDALYNGLVSKITPDAVYFTENYLDLAGKVNTREVVKRMSTAPGEVQ